MVAVVGEAALFRLPDQILCRPVLELVPEEAVDGEVLAMQGDAAEQGGVALLERQQHLTACL